MGASQRLKNETSTYNTPNAPEPRRGAVLPMLVALFMIICSVLYLPFEAVESSAAQAEMPFFEAANATGSGIKSDSLRAIFTMPRVYTLPWSEESCPKSDPNGWFGDDGYDYKDETIELHYWKEFIANSNVHFAEIIIQHPTQIRTAWAGGRAGSAELLSPEQIARDVNAVVAINADFASYRDIGVIYRQGSIVRDNPHWRRSTLAIEANGNLNIVRDSKMDTFAEDNRVINSFLFGPVLVIDGEAKVDYDSGVLPGVIIDEYHPRATVGQIGPLHYLLCVVEGRSEESQGVTCNRLAKIMRGKGCTIAYNLDGGMSAAMVINGKVVNDRYSGGRRYMCDILYFATAVPNDGA